MRLYPVVGVRVNAAVLGIERPGEGVGSDRAARNSVSENPSLAVDPRVEYPGSETVVRMWCDKEFVGEIPPRAADTEASTESADRLVDLEEGDGEELKRKG